VSNQRKFIDGARWASTLSKHLPTGKSPSMANQLSSFEPPKVRLVLENATRQFAAGNLSRRRGVLGSLWLRAVDSRFRQRIASDRRRSTKDLTVISDFHYLEDHP
jgi:hypothetical protein